MAVETAKLVRAHPVNSAAPTRAAVSGAAATRSTLAVSTTGVATACSHPRRRGSGSGDTPVSSCSLRHGADLAPVWPRAVTSTSAIAVPPASATRLLDRRSGGVREAGRGQVGVDLSQTAADLPTQ